MRPGRSGRTGHARVATLPAERPLRIDELTTLQVAEHAHLSDHELADALCAMASRALAARRAMPAGFRATPYDPAIPGEPPWTFGYLFDVIHTRDPWMHRVDISRATGHRMRLSADHDGRLIADAVADWARRHERPFTLRLGGPAGGGYHRGEGGAVISIDSVEFCRMLSGRAPGSDLFGVAVPF